MAPQDGISRGRSQWPQHQGVTRGRFKKNGHNSKMRVPPVDHEPTKHRPKGTFHANEFTLSAFFCNFLAGMSTPPGEGVRYSQLVRRQLTAPRRPPWQRRKPGKTPEQGRAVKANKGVSRKAAFGCQTTSMPWTHELLQGPWEGPFSF